MSSKSTPDPSGTSVTDVAPNVRLSPDHLC